MNYKNILKLNNISEFRSWLELNSINEDSCYLSLKRGKPTNDKDLWYIDAVYIALCFGWIDSTLTRIDGTSYQKFTKRRNNSNWAELNKERVRYLEKKNLMTDEGRKVLPDMSFTIEPIILEEIKKNGLLEIFNSFPPLYQRVRASNLYFYYKLDKESYDKALNNFIKNTKQGKMYGNWNDYGRLE